MHWKGLLLGAIAIASAQALPASSDSLLERSTDCTKPQERPSPDCWNTLGMTSWLQDWWKQNKDSCNGSPFAECFQFHQNITGQSCGNVTVGGCTAPNAFKFDDQHVFYALWNIYVSSYGIFSASSCS